jgi:hypothetical protein
MSWTFYAARLFFAAAALAAGAPAPVQATGRVLWVEMCDALHAGGKIPLPLDRDDRAPGQACHAACGVLPERRGNSRDPA